MEDKTILNLTATYEEAENELTSVVEIAELLKNTVQKLQQFKQLHSETTNLLTAYRASTPNICSKLRHIVSSVSNLHYELDKMDAAIQNCSTMADRYGNKGILDKCKEIIYKCHNTMGIIDIDSHLKEVVSLNEKLTEIAKSFDDDTKLRKAALSYIEQHTLLQKSFTAYVNDLKQIINQNVFINHNALFQVIDKRIDRFASFHKVFLESQNQINIIYGFADQYGKSRLLNDWNKLVDTLQGKMVYGNIDEFQKKVEKFTSRSQSLLQCFADEKIQLDRILDDLHQNNTMFWSDDYSQLELLISEMQNQRTPLLNSSNNSNTGTRRTVTLDQLRDTIEEKKKVRAALITATESKHRWLARKRWIGNNSYYFKYKGFSDKNITALDYERQVTELVKEHRRNSWLIVGKTLKYAAIVASFAIIIPIWIIKQFIGSDSKE